ncbi:hypothetical protein L13192_02701 [Pyrenophora tritici-repentis]|nr:hypothetical protein L13192_02701 [Pyrenophora tritici-repentis]
MGTIEKANSATTCLIGFSSIVWLGKSHAPADRQQLQPLEQQPQAPPQSQLQPLEQLLPQLQRPLPGEQQDDRQGDQQDSRQGEQYGARQGVRSHPQYQELQQPPYAINAYTGPQPRRQTEQAMRPQQWYPQTQTRPPATAYREVTTFPQQPTNRVPNRPLSLPHNLYKTLPPR